MGERAETPDKPGEKRTRPTEAEIVALADRQHVVFAYWQLVDLGLTRGAIEHRLAAGRLYRVHHGVYSLTPSLTPRGHVMAAVLACGPDALLSHRSAADLHGLRQTNQRKTDVTVPRKSRHGRPTIRIHSSTFDPEDVATVDNIPVTSVARTILDLAGVLDEHQLLRAIENAERLQKFDLRALHRAMARRPRARGIAKLRRVLATYREPPDTRSELERTFLELIRSSPLPDPLVNTIVAGLEVDFCWPRFKLVVELDGRAYHSSRRAFETDRIRDATLQRHGYRVLRITYRRLKEEPEAVLADILALARLAA
jgi:very-short-patch-repair endonuclease